MDRFMAVFEVTVAALSQHPDNVILLSAVKIK
jgi:hypothetical protein